MPDNRFKCEIRASLTEPVKLTSTGFDIHSEIYGGLNCHTFDIIYLTIDILETVLARLNDDDKERLKRELIDYLCFPENLVDNGSTRITIDRSALED